MASDIAAYRSRLRLAIPTPRSDFAIIGGMGIYRQESVSKLYGVRRDPPSRCAQQMSATRSITTATPAEGSHRFAVCVREPATEFAVWRSQAGKRNYTEGAKDGNSTLYGDWAGGCFTLC
jgi:hypothetical protein